MLNIVIIAILLISFWVGLKRGFILQIIHLASFLVSIFVAYTLYKDVASYLRLWIPYPSFSADGIVPLLLEAVPLETFYYNAIAFVLLFFATKIVLNMVAKLLNFVKYIPFLRTVNGVLGGILCFVQFYFILFVLLHVSNLLPIEAVQEEIGQSFIANVIMNHTPIFSNMLDDFRANLAHFS